MKKKYLSLYRYILNERNYPFNFLVLFVLGFIKFFMYFFIFNSLFLNFLTGNSFTDGIAYSFVFAFLYILISVICYLHPFQFFKILFCSLEKTTDYLLLKILGIFRK